MSVKLMAADSIRIPEKLLAGVLHCAVMRPPVEGRSPTPMPTTKDRTPAAWRSQVPPDVRSLARGAADHEGDRSESGPRAKPADRNRQGTNS